MIVLYLTLYQILKIFIHINMGIGYLYLMQSYLTIIITNEIK